MCHVPRRRESVLARILAQGGQLEKNETILISMEETYHDAILQLKPANFDRLEKRWDRLPIRIRYGCP